MTLDSVFLKITRAQKAVAIAKNISELSTANIQLTNALWELSEIERNERLDQAA